MMAAKSATWSYLKRAWDNDLAFERASRSLAKTGWTKLRGGGFLWTPLESEKTIGFLMFFEDGAVCSIS